ncbi:ADP-ribosylglycohydrolase family protein [Lachnospiraceae bacterium 54-53]
MKGQELLRRKIKGALIGIAYGDSFGMPVEMWSRKRIASVYGEIREHLPGNSDNFISKGFQAWEVTDDTVNTALVIQMLAGNRGRVDAREFLRLLKEWARSSSKSSAVIGPSTARAMELIDAGVPMEQTGLMGTTNGAAMKILPLGLLHDMAHLTEMVEDVRELCLPTHNTSSAVSGASAVAAAACYALHDGRDLDEMMRVSGKAAEMGTAYGNQIGAPSISARLELVRQYAACHTVTEVRDFLGDIIGAGLPIEESAVSAISYAFLSGGDPEACAVYAVNGGGDTDTVAAMACGICGALGGEEAFDRKIVGKIEERNDLSFEDLAEKLMAARSMRYGEKGKSG